VSDGARPSLTVVVVTYEWPDALDLVLQALSEQRGESFEIVVAEDGSGAATAAVVERWKERLGKRLAYVRQRDEGWRQARNRNLGATAARGDFLVFLDGDCLARPRFVEAVRRAAAPGTFLAGKRLHLSAELSHRVLRERLPVWRWSLGDWLLRAPRELFTSPRETATPGVLVPLRDRRLPWRTQEREFVPPYNAYGFFFGVRRDDFERVNGFDMRFEGWGGEDEDLAARLRLAGLQCRWPGPRTTPVHLWHQPKKGTMRSNAPLVAETEAERRVEATAGLRELEAELAAGAAAP
jgi:GT2 family glycosyltransferase